MNRTTNIKALAFVLVAAGLVVAQQYPPPQQYPQAQQYPQQGYPPYSQEQNYPQQDNEGPGPGVARMSLINGDVSVKRGDSGELTAAVLNAPLMAQDQLMTADGSRAEIQFDSSNLMRLAPDSEVHLADLQNGHLQVQIGRGEVSFRVSRDDGGQVEIDTPSVGVHPVRRGLYRITVHPDGTSEITVRAGEAEIFGPRGNQRVGAGQTILARGLASDPEFQIVAAPREDEWDRWNEQRDRELDRSRSYQYVSPDVSGAQDLDAYGRWSNDPEYGYVWSPTGEPAGWAPYQQGQWVWTGAYGWTWVSYDPWGWAPYHYGRWFYRPTGWCWYPGGLRGRQYWSPALVGFIGFGGGGGFGFGFGNVGWVPLAPFEPFHRWWGGGYRRGFEGRSTIINNVNVAGTYRNARFSNGITGVSAGNFGRGGSVQHFSYSAGQIGHAGVINGQVPLTPSRESMRFSNRAVVQPRGGSVGTAQHFFGQRQPAAGVNRSFNGGAQSGAVQNSGNGGWQRLGGSAPHGSAPQGVNQGSRSFGAPVQSRGMESPARSSGVGNSGWGRFGEPMHSPESTVPSGRSFSGGGQPQRYNQAAPEQPRYAPSTRSNYSNGGGYSRGEAIHITPPIVHERPAGPSGGGRSGGGSPGPAFHGSGGGGGPRGGGSPAPAFHGGGGGGGGPRSGGGGGAPHGGGGGGHSGHR
jgi:FecR protein